MGTMRHWKNDVGGDAPSHRFVSMRLLLSFTVEDGLEIGKLDVNSPYLQAKRFRTDIFPPTLRGEGQRWSMDVVTTILWLYQVCSSLEFNIIWCSHARLLTQAIYIGSIFTLELWRGRSSGACRPRWPLSISWNYGTFITLRIIPSSETTHRFNWIL